jgi:hypothetical protein
MAQGSLKKVSKAAKPADSTERLRKALTKCRKDELVGWLVELAKSDRGIQRQLATRFELAATPRELLDATRRAICDATDFDEREINYNFDYDCEAYEEVKRNFHHLVARGQFERAMELSSELMKAGSYQAEISDEGLMTDDIEECLMVVIQALKSCNLPSDEVITWCSSMLAADHVGFTWVSFVTTS